MDWNIRDGIDNIPIEERGNEEVNRIEGVLESGEVTEVSLMPDLTATANYAFDVTPARLVTGLITERGLCGASEEEIRALFPDYG